MSTDPLRMLRLEPDATAITRWGAERGLIRSGADDGYLWHSLLTAAFGELAPKPFRLVTRDNRPLHLLAYARCDAAALRLQAQTFAEPDIYHALRLDTLADKPMPTSFAPHQRLGFEVRLRPTIRRTRDGNRDRKREQDVFIQVAERLMPGPKPARLDVYREWLASQLSKGGAQLEHAKLDAHQRARILRRGKADADGQRKLQSFGEKGGGPDIVMSGTLKIDDPAAFHALLARGIGRHRAFGFGMLLLQPPKQGE